MDTSTRRRISPKIVCLLACLFGAAQAQGEDGAAAHGEKLVTMLGCMECHTAHGKGAGVFAEIKAPEWAGAFGKTIEMENGEKIMVTEAYLLKAITEPDAHVVKGYPAGEMPTLYAHLAKEDLAALVAFIKGLTPQAATVPVAASAEDTDTAPKWVEGGDVGRGEKLVRRLGCVECHMPHERGAGVKAPEWTGIFGTTIETQSGQMVKITEAYLLESITNPNAQVVKGFPAGKMPARFDALPKEDLQALVAFIRNLTPSATDSGEVAGPN